MECPGRQFELYSQLLLTLTLVENVPPRLILSHVWRDYFC